MLHYLEREKSRANAYGGVDDVSTIVVDPEGDEPLRYAVRYNPHRYPRRHPADELIGYGDTLDAATELVRDHRNRVRGIGWLWVHDRDTDRAWFMRNGGDRGRQLPPRSDWLPL